MSADSAYSRCCIVACDWVWSSTLEREKEGERWMTKRETEREGERKKETQIERGREGV